MASRPRRREDPEVRRAQILRAAEYCFRTLGFQASTVDRIAAEAQVSVGLLYRFFDSKSSIIEAIIIDDLRRQLEDASLAIDMAAGEPTRILKSIADTLATATVHLDRVGLAFEITAEICRNASLRSFVRTKRAEAQNVLIEKLMEKRLARRTAERIIDRLDVMGVLMSGAAIHNVLYASGPNARFQRLISKLLDGLTTSSTSRRPAKAGSRGRR